MWVLFCVYRGRQSYRDQPYCWSDTHDKAVRWESVGDGSFTVAEVTKDSRGTDVIPHLKEDETEFLTIIVCAP